MRVMRFWIVELGEVGNTLRKERMDALKQYITQNKMFLEDHMHVPRK